MSEDSGQDQFKPVANRRAGYTTPLEWALKIARRGGTLAAGEGLLLVEHYEERIAALEQEVFGLKAEIEHLQREVAVQ